MAIREVLLLGNEKLYSISREVDRDEIEKAREIIEDLHDTMMDFKARYGFGRAIAAPQIDEAYRVIYMNIDGRSTAFINPVLEPVGDETFEMWDDCMSFPGLEVRLSRYKKVRIRYKDLDWKDCVLLLEGDLAELIQHEYDHLDGILAVQRALDDKSLRMNKDKAGKY